MRLRPGWTRGRGPGGAATSSGTGHSPTGLFETGLRLSEWASLLDVELPSDDPGRAFVTCWLADAGAKGGYGRRFWLPRPALAGVLAYVEGRRAAAAGSAVGPLQADDGSAPAGEGPRWSPVAAARQRRDGPQRLAERVDPRRSAGGCSAGWMPGLSRWRYGLTRTACPARSTGGSTRSPELTSASPRSAWTRWSACRTDYGTRARCAGTRRAGRASNGWICPTEPTAPGPYGRTNASSPRPVWRCRARPGVGAALGTRRAWQPRPPQRLSPVRGATPLWRLTSS